MQGRHRQHRYRQLPLCWTPGSPGHDEGETLAVMTPPRAVLRTRAGQPGSGRDVKFLSAISPTRSSPGRRGSCMGRTETRSSRSSCRAGSAPVPLPLRPAAKGDGEHAVKGAGPSRPAQRGSVRTRRAPECGRASAEITFKLRAAGRVHSPQVQMNEVQETTMKRNTPSPRRSPYRYLVR